MLVTEISGPNYCIICGWTPPQEGAPTHHLLTYFKVIATASELTQRNSTRK